MSCVTLEPHEVYSALEVQLPPVLAKLVVEALTLQTPCCGVLTPDTTLSPCKVCATLLCENCVWPYYRGPEVRCLGCVKGNRGELWT